MFNFWKNLFCFAFLPMYFGGGGGSSSAATTNNTTNTQTQTTVDGGSTLLTGGDSSNFTINNTSTDNGAVTAALNSSTSNFSTLIDAFKVMSKSGADSLSANMSLARDLTGGVQSAYKDAAAQAQGNKNIVYAGLAVVAIVGVGFMIKKG